MGTRSIIGIAHDGGFTGRYCHWDGYPTCRAAELLATYRELDSDWKAVEAYAVKPDVPGYWSSYQTPSQAIAEAAKPDKVPCHLCGATGNRTDMVLHKANWCNGCDGTGSARNIDKQQGYTTDNGDSWASDQDDWGAEWAYLLDERGITVLCNTEPWKLYGLVPWDTSEDGQAALLEAIEQGAIATVWG